MKEIAVYEVRIPFSFSPTITGHKYNELQKIGASLLMRLAIKRSWRVTFARCEPDVSQDEV